MIVSCYYRNRGAGPPTCCSKEGTGDHLQIARRFWSCEMHSYPFHCSVKAMLSVASGTCLETAASAARAFEGSHSIVYSVQAEPRHKLLSFRNAMQSAVTKYTHDVLLWSRSTVAAEGDCGECWADRKLKQCLDVHTRESKMYLANCGAGAAELLAARGATLLTMLAEREAPLFLDSAAEGHAAHVAADVSLCIARNTGRLLVLTQCPERI